jgi:electron transfer flavoprotein beta subunit
MKIVVCVKQVPDTTSVRINEKTGTMEREGVPTMVNPYDLYAVEEALKVKEQHGGEVMVLSMGPPQVQDALREVISMGVDDARLLCDREFAGADTLATSYTLARGLARIGEYDLIFCGKQAIDGDTAQVGPELAEHLNLPFIGFVRKIREVRPGFICAERMTDDGGEVVESSLPAVVSVVKEINEPRLPSLRGKMKAKKFEAVTWSAADLEVDKERIGLKGSPTWVVRSFTPEPRGGGEILEGRDSAELASKLAEKIRELGVCS